VVLTIDGSQDHPDKRPGNQAGKDGQQRVLRDVLGKEGDRVRAGSEIEHVAEGKPAHEPVENVETQDEDAEDDEVRRPVDPEEGKDYKKPGGDDGDVQQLPDVSFRETRLDCFHGP